MIRDFDGAEVIDASGEEVGTVERTYLDDDENPRYVVVAMEGAGKHLVPTGDAETTEGGLRVPYSRQAIEASPDASSADDTLEGSLLEAVRAYYSRWQEGGAAPTEENDLAVASVPVNATTTETEGSAEPAPTAGQVRDLGDVIEVPIVEEVVVKQPVVKEVLRIRKTAATSTETVQGQVRKEEVEIERQGDATGGEPADAS